MIKPNVIFTGALLAAVSIAIPTSPVEAQPQTKDQQKCISGVNKATAKVAATQGKDTNACLKGAAKGSLPGTAQDCLTADLKMKVQKAKNKTTGVFTGKCPMAPNFAFTDATTANDAAVDEDVALAEDIFGVPLDTAIAGATTSTDFKCQQALQKAWEKLAKTKFKEFNKCKKSALKGGADSGDDITSCMNNIQPSNPKVQKAVDKLSDAATKKCAGVTLANVFPGNCPAPDQATFLACVEAKVECTACVTMALTDALNADCDSIDNSMIDFSCTSFCSVDPDCASGVCVGGQCQPPTCTDGVQNGQETCIDCGGPDCPACPIGCTCDQASDCTSGICQGGECTCGDNIFFFTIGSSSGGTGDPAEWPGGTQQLVDAPGCTVTADRPSGNIDLVGNLGDDWSVLGFGGYASCVGQGGEDGDGCLVLSCPPAGIGSCESNRPSCSAALNGSGSARFEVSCTD